MASGIAHTMAGLALGATLAFGGPAAADQWDQATDSDNGTGTDNTPGHGSEQVHDLAALPGPQADEDWYRVAIDGFSSYQFVVDGLTGDLDLDSNAVQLFNEQGTLIGNALPEGQGVLTMEWLGGAAATVTGFVRVRGAACGTACDDRDRYRARFYDTTYTIPRFNNSGTQSTVLLIQNVTSQGCGFRVFFLGADGLPLALPAPVTAFPRQLLVVPGLPGQSGSVRIAHTCGYGGLSGKAVSVEAATGFTFDTPMEPRTR